MTARVAIIGSSTWPTPADVVAYVASLSSATVVVSGGATGADTFAELAASQAGLAIVRHLPDRQRYGDGAYYHRNKAIVEDCDRVVAFAAKDPATKQITAGTSMTIGLARRADVPVEIIETPVPGRVCVLISRMRHRYEGIKTAPTSNYAVYRVRSARELIADLIVVRNEFDRRLTEGEAEIQRTTDTDAIETMSARWLGWLATYEIVCDVVKEAIAVVDSVPMPNGPRHRTSLHRATEMVEVVA